MRWDEVKGEEREKEDSANRMGVDVYCRRVNVYTTASTTRRMKQTCLIVKVCDRLNMIVHLNKK